MQSTFKYPISDYWLKIVNTISFCGEGELCSELF